MKLNLLTLKEQKNCKKDLEKYSEIILTLNGRNFISDLATDPVYKEQLMCRKGDELFLDYPPEDISEKSGWSIFTLAVYSLVGIDYKLIGKIDDNISALIKNVDNWKVTVHKSISEKAGHGTLFKPKLAISLKNIKS